MTEQQAQQLKSLTTIRKLVEKDFSHIDFQDIEWRLCEEIDLKNYEEIEYEKSRGYIIKTLPRCKVCNDIDKDFLTEFQTLRGSFHICDDCKREIASAEA